MCLGTVSWLVWWEPCRNPIKQVQFLGKRYDFCSLFMFPPQSTLPISLSLEFSVWLLFSLVINDAMPAKKHVCLFSENTRISITWEDRIDLVRKTWGFRKKKKKKRVLNLGYLNQKRRRR